MIIWVAVILQWMVLVQWLPSNIDPFDKAHEDLIFWMLFGFATINSSIQELVKKKVLHTTIKINGDDNTINVINVSDRVKEENRG
jgi:hypothetical protein